jgi:hypothetical protein
VTVVLLVLPAAAAVLAVVQATFAIPGASRFSATECAQIVRGWQQRARPLH